jgi:hypothetical protein
MKLSIAACVATLIALVTALPAAAEDEFKGKTIRLVVATPAGGGYDAYGRIVARHLGDYLPGHPNVTVVNMPGASGMNATSWLYSQAPRDGSVIATFNKSQPFYEALGQPGVRFKSRELSWIASLSQAADVVSVWHTTGVRSIEDAKRRQIVMGSDSSGTMTLYPALLNATIGTRFKIVTGYPGSAAVALALARGEVEGIGSAPWTSWKATHPDWVRNRWIVPLVQVGLTHDHDLGDVPLLIELAQSDEHRILFNFVSAPAAIERPFAGPPDMPFLALYRRAFAAMAKDPAVHDEIARLNLDLNPRTGEDVAHIVDGIVTTAPAVIARVKAMIGQGG